MKIAARIRTVALSAAFVAFTASFAHAQATRTWVSGVGDDANPCSRTAPCKTFAGAISKTAVGGFIDALDSGGFGAVTITKSITLEGYGVIAGILASGTKGVIINSATAIVHLRNLSIESPKPGGPAPQGIDGIDVIAASQVHVQHCVIASFSNTAINFHPASGSLFVSDTDIMNNTAGGIVVSTGRVTIENLRATGNANGVVVVGNAIATVRNSYAAGNSVGFAAVVNPAAIMNLENVVASNNTTGVQVNSGATARISNSTIVSNSANGLQNDGVSFLVSLSGNAVFGNPATAAFTSTQVKQ